MANSRELATHAAALTNMVVLGDFNIRPCNCFRHSRAPGEDTAVLKTWELDLRARTGARCSRCAALVKTASQPGEESVAAVFELVAPPAGSEGWTFGRWVRGSNQLAPHGCLDYTLVAGGERRQWSVRDAYVV